MAYSEMGIGAALLTPFVNKRLAGLALGAFSAGLLAMYFRNPDMTQEDGIRPTEAGTGLSKDAFLAAIAAAWWSPSSHGPSGTPRVPHVRTDGRHPFHISLRRRGAASSPDGGAAQSLGRPRRPGQ
ncbi:hypothetical protein [Kocuria sp. CNJ-770]|uniref:hypothetical protein n=1 Tax=Kocuria sp. CNJ-770 TaxID=1904964 RepID=UPI00351253F3